MRTAATAHLASAEGKKQVKFAAPWLLRWLLALGLLLQALGLSTAWAANAWQPAGLAGTLVRGLAIHPTTPTTLYASRGADGVAKSTDGGANWSFAGNGLGGAFAWPLAIDPVAPSTVYVGSPGGGVFKSTNGGASWAAASSGLTNNIVWSLVVDPSTPTTLYAGTDGYGGGVYKSIDGGASWVQLNLGLPNGSYVNVRLLLVDPAVPGTLYGVVNDRVYKSTNGGGVWVEFNSGLTGAALSLALDPVTPGTLYAGTYDGRVFKSTNGGANWSVAGGAMASSGVQALAVAPTTPVTLYAATFTAGVFKSTDGGASWSAASSGLTSNQTLALVLDPTAPATLYVGTSDAGAFKSTNGALSSETRLRGLVLEAGGGPIALSPAFSRDTLGYAATVASGTASAALIPTAWSGDASMLVNGAAVASGSASALLALNSGVNTLTVVVVSGDGTSSQTYTVAVTRQAPPAAPTGVSATAGNGQATVSWSAPADNGSAITNYTVTAVEDGSKQCTPSPATGTICTVTGLTNGTAYTFTVTATNGVGIGSASAASAPVTPAGLPGAPTAITASPGAPGSGQVTLTWTPPIHNGSAITSYTVTPAGTGPACTASPCALSGLANAAQYSFTVQATNGVGQGAVSAASDAVWLQGTQAINFPAQAGQTYVPHGTFAINPGASATSAQAVTYGSQTVGVCTVLGSTVTMTGAGTCILSANQAGDAAWAAAPQATQNVAIAPGVNAITFPAQANQAFALGGSFAISPAATGRSSAAVIYTSLTTGVCTVSGSTVAMVSAGTCTIAANQAADANWAAAPQATQGVQIASGVPGAPPAATAMPGNGQAVVSWTAPIETGGGITQYGVTAPGTAGCTAAWPATSCTVPGLTNGATYTFSVRAENSAGPGAPAVAPPVTPLADSKAFSAPSLTGSGTVGVAVSGGGAICAFERVQLLHAGSASTAPPANVQFPYGLLDFVLAGCNQSNVAVTITYPGPLPQGVQYWKLSGGAWAPYGGATAVAGATTATLVLADGGQGDDDGTPNGRIVDPGQVGVLAAPGPGGVGAAAIPTLSEMALLVLTTLMALAGAARVQRRRPN